SFFFFQAEDGIRDFHVTGVQTCALPISPHQAHEMTADTLEAPAVSASSAAPPHPAREFWGYFSANHGAVAGLAIVVAVILVALRSEERRVGKECRSRGAALSERSNRERT